MECLSLLIHRVRIDTFYLGFQKYFRRNPQVAGPLDASRINVGHVLIRAFLISV